MINEDRIQKIFAMNKFILDIIEEQIIYLDKNLKVKWLNKAASEATGKSQDEIKGQLCCELFNHPKIFCESCPVKRSAKTGELCKARISTADNKIFDIHAHPLKKNKNDINGTIMVVKDITQKENAVSSDIYTKNIYKAIFENTGSATVLINKDTTIDVANSLFEKLSGYAKKDIEGKMSWTDFVVPEDLKRMKKQHDLRRNDNRRALNSYEFRFIDRNQNIKDILLTVDMIPETNNSVASLLDITEKNTYLRNLINREKNLSALLENPSGYIIYRTRFNIETNKIDIINVSPSAHDILGLDGKELMTFSDWFKHIDHEDIERIKEASDRGMKPPFIFEETVRYHHPEKGLIWLEIRARGVPYDNNPQCIEYANGIILDITKQKLFEQELNIAKNKAEESDRLKSAFLANISHEIRTPMNGILGFIELLNSEELSEDRQKNYLNIVNKSGQRMLNTLNDLIDIAKIEAGVMKVHHNNFNFVDELHHIYDFFKPAVQEKGLTFILDLPKVSQHKIINSDQNKFTTIISSLIKNAIKFTDKGSISLVCEVKNNELTIAVKDTGSGIPDSRQDAIFNRFEQGDIKDHLAKQGSGLGLSIAKAYTDMIGAKLWFETTLNEGSTFFLSLPLNNNSKNGSIDIMTKSQEINKALSDSIILIVEDDEDSQFFLKIILENRCKKIILVQNGLEAVKAVKENKNIDFILMDIKLPKMDGVTATHEIRKFNKNVYIIAQTAYAFHGDKDKFINAGCNEYITKPINKEKLLSIFNKYLS